MKELELLKKPLFWLICLLGLIWAAIFQLPDSQFHLVFCDVGQGDAVLIRYRSTQVLIDGGPNGKVLECLSENLPFWDRELEMVVLTHPDADHVTGLVEVFRRYKVKQLLVNSIVKDSAVFWEFYRAVLEEGVRIYSPQADDQISLGPMRFLVLWPEEKLGDSRVWYQDGVRVARHLQGGRNLNSTTVSSSSEVLGFATYSDSDETNETSIVLKLSFGNFDALLAGDIGFDTEKKINWSASQLGSGPIEVLKVPHHGSKNSTGEEFLQKVQPQLAVISVGKNPWGHPTKETISRLNSQAINLLRTDQQGEIEVVFDGQKWGIKK